MNKTKPKVRKVKAWAVVFGKMDTIEKRVAKAHAEGNGKLAEKILHLTTKLVKPSYSGSGRSEKYIPMNDSYNDGLIDLQYELMKYLGRHLATLPKPSKKKTR